MPKVLRNFAWLTAASVLSQSLGAVALIYASRSLGPSVFGILAMAQALANLALTTADMGLGRLGTRFIATGERAGIAFDLVALRTALNLGFLLIMGAGCLLLRQPPLEIQLVLLCSAATMGLALAPDFVWAGIQSFRTFSLVQMGQQAVRAVGIVVALILTGSVLSVPIATLAAGTVGALLLWKLLPAGARQGRIDPRRWPRYFLAGLPIGLAATMPDLYVNGDSLMVRAFLGFRALGEYAAAYRLLLICLTLGGLFIAALFPELCRLRSESERRDELVQRALRLSLAGAVPVAVVALMVPGPLVHLLYGSSYAAGGPTARLLLLTPLPALPNLVLSSVLVADGRNRLNLMLVGLGGVLNLGLDALLLPRIGIAGAGLATLTAEAVVLVGLVLSVRPRPALPAHLQLAASGTAMLLTLVVLSDRPLVVTLPTALAVYLLCTFRSITGREILGAWFRRTPLAAARG